MAESEDIMKVKNKFTERVYETIQYSYENYEKCKTFITEKMDISIHPIMPDMTCYGLKSYEDITRIKPSDYIIRTITDGLPLYNNVTEEIMKSNFEITK